MGTVEMFHKIFIIICYYYRIFSCLLFISSTAECPVLEGQITKNNNICITDNDCAPTYYCYTKSSKCAPCQDCSPYHRQPSLKVCAKEVGDCGPCIEGFKAEEIFNRENHQSDYCSKIKISSTPSYGVAYLITIISICVVVLFIIVIIFIFLKRKKNNLKLRETPNDTSEISLLTRSVSEKKGLEVQCQDHNISDPHLSDVSLLNLPDTDLKEQEITSSRKSRMNNFLNFQRPNDIQNVIQSVLFRPPVYEEDGRIYERNRLLTSRYSYPDHIGERGSNYTFRSDNIGSTTTQRTNVPVQSGRPTHSRQSSDPVRVPTGNNIFRNNSTENSQEIYNPVLPSRTSSRRSSEGSSGYNSGPNHRQYRSENDNFKDCFGNASRIGNIGLQENKGNNSVLRQDNSSKILQNVLNENNTNIVIISNKNM